MAILDLDGAPTFFESAATLIALGRALAAARPSLAQRAKSVSPPARLTR
jgi:hypothetical protein